VNGDTVLIRALVGCYPAAWRRRYGDEYAQLLCDLRVHRRPGLVVNSLLGAARVHGGVLMSSDSPMTLAVWAAGLFTVAGIGFAKLAEDFTGVAAAPHAFMIVASAVALLALVAAAAPAGAVLLRGRDRGAWKYVAVPVAGAAVWYGVLRTAVGMTSATVAALIWGLRIRSADAAGFRGHQGLLATPFVPSWVTILVALAAASALSGLAARRQLAAVG
jgi:hypothetical protein